MTENTENKPDAVVPVRGHEQKNGYTKKDVPDGFITWDEHFEAWFAYHDANPRSISAEEMANNGGFTFNEMIQWLGHTPRSWVPRNMVKYKSYFDELYNPSDAPVEEEEEPPAVTEVLSSHIWYTNGVSICKGENDEPTIPFNFDVIDGPSCELCLDKVLSWLRKWNGVED